MINRIIAQAFKRLASQYPVVTLTGPRQSGKTTLCQALFPNHDYVNLEGLDKRQFALEDPKGFLSQFSDGVILDEIQRTPDLPSYIQVIVDAEPQKKGRFILTGSQQFEITNSINQSLAGRTALLTLLPFSFRELYHANSMPSLNEILYQGFYPRIFDQQLNPTEALSFYLHTYVERDIRSLIKISNLSTFERFVRLCAGNVGQLINHSRLASDCGVDQKTIKAWLSILKASYIIFELPPHFKNFRKRLVKTSKLYFYDVGLACYLLGISNPTHLSAHPLRGALFENFIVSEFLKNRYNHIQDNNLYYFRDTQGHEVDLILDNGTNLTAVEIKSSQTTSRSSFAGLDYYNKIAQHEQITNYLIYAGNESYQRGNNHLYSFYELDKLFEKLKSDFAPHN